MNRFIFVALLAAGLAAGCGKKETSAAANPETNAVTASQPASAPAPVPGAMQTPTAPQNLTDTSSIDATLAELTRELHRTMIGRKLSGSFEEFVAIRNLKVPPPPPGKKYAISKQWRVILVDAN